MDPKRVKIWVSVRPDIFERNPWSDAIDDLSEGEVIYLLISPNIKDYPSISRFIHLYRSTQRRGYGVYRSSLAAFSLLSQ